MRHTATKLLAALLAGVPAASAVAGPDCQVAHFQGATLPQGAETRMTVVNRGAPCSISSYGVTGSTKENPAYSGEITVMPQHGSAVFDAPHTSYTPAADFTGEDQFAYEAIAKDRNGRTLRLRVRVNVTVVAP